MRYERGVSGRLLSQGWDLATETLHLSGLDQITWERQVGDAFLRLINSLEKYLEHQELEISLDELDQGIDAMVQYLLEKIIECQKEIETFCTVNKRAYQAFNEACRKYSILFNPIESLKGFVLIWAIM